MRATRLAEPQSQGFSLMSLSRNRHAEVIATATQQPSDVLRRARVFAQYFPDSVVLLLTETMLAKSIIDASAPVREMLKRTGIHDFELQGQGPDAKSIIAAVIFSFRDGVATTLDSQASLYRPNTKDGDPRFWLYELGSHASTGNTLAIGVAGDRTIVAVNLSAAQSEAEWLAVEAEFAPLGVAEDQPGNPPLDRLIAKLTDIAHAGPTPADGHGDTAVGRTMETALGISINSSKDPDWEGVIELKFGRPRPAQRRTMFAKVPNWKLSTLQSSREILERFGYERDGVFRLYVEVGAKPNSRGLMLRADEKAGLIRESSTLPDVPEVAVWQLADLQRAMLNKHQQTCWIVCEESERAGITYFQPTEVQYTRAPRVDLIPLLIEAGEMTLDHLIKEKDGAVREKGPLWKISKAASPQLLPVVSNFKLLDD